MKCNSNQTEGLSVYVFVLLYMFSMVLGVMDKTVRVTSVDCQSWVQVSNDSEGVIALCDHHSHSATSQIIGETALTVSHIIYQCFQ